MKQVSKHLCLQIPKAQPPSPPHFFFQYSPFCLIEWYILWSSTKIYNEVICIRPQIGWPLLLPIITVKPCLCVSSPRIWQGPLCAHERLAAGLCLDLWKSLRKMSLEQGEKTLGINNWKFNQDGFKDVYVCVWVWGCVHVHISNRRAIRHVPETLAG